MKILIWSQYFWPENFLINKLTSELCERGVEVTVITGKPNYPDGKIFQSYKAWGIQREEYCGSEVIRIPIYPRGKNSLVGLFLNYMSFILMGYLLVPFLLRKRKFDAVFVYAPSPLLQALPAIGIAWLKNIPLVLWVQDLWPTVLETTGFIKNKRLLQLVRWVVRYIYQCSDVILIQSEAFRVSVENLAKSNRNIYFFPNFSDDLLEVAATQGHKDGISLEIEKNFSIVFSGNLGKFQSCETIVLAADLLREYSEIKFYLVGNGSQFASIESLVQRKRLGNVVMTGSLPSEAMPAIFSASSVLLISLCNDPELSATVPSKLQSYFSAGKPILASVNGEAARLVIDANAGVTCSAENPGALAKAVLQLYKMTQTERIQLGINAHRYFKKHFHVMERITELIACLKLKVKYK